MGAAKSSSEIQRPRPGEPPPSDNSGVLYWLGDLFSKRGKEIIASAVLSAVGIASYANLGFFEQRARDFIVDATVSDLNSDNSKLIDPISKLFAETRKSEVGALNAGQFWLTPSSRAYTLYIYFPQAPKKYTGKIFYTLKGVSENKYVVLILPNGKSMRIEDTESSIDLAKYIDVGTSLERQGIEGILDQPGALKNLRAITFQLAGPALDAPASDDKSPGGGTAVSGVEVNYVSLVTPAIQLDK